MHFSYIFSGDHTVDAEVPKPYKNSHIKYDILIITRLIQLNVIYITPNHNKSHLRAPNIIKTCNDEKLQQFSFLNQTEIN